MLAGQVLELRKRPRKRRRRELRSRRRDGVDRRLACAHEAESKLGAHWCNRVRSFLLRAAIVRQGTFVDLDEVDLVAVGAYPVGFMTRAAEIRICFFGFLAARIFAR